MKRKQKFLSAYSTDIFGRLKRGLDIYRQYGEMADKIQKFKQCLAYYKNNKPVSEIAHEQEDETLTDIANHVSIKSLTLYAVKCDACKGRKISRYRYAHKDEFDF